MMKGGLAGMMKQAQQMQQNMKKAQAELATIEVEGQAGSGMVRVTMTCAHDVRRVILDDSLMSDDKEIVEDLIVAAVNDATKQVATVTQQKMSGFTAGMNLPPGMSLPL
ncbi:MAG: YbaB/EbfC family nucleoid-associated protein [Candidatus Nitrotoga sp.]|nr:YbaB/EbfC family nucleoid-associated protein [Candidatus Nitrotoga sp.]MBP0117816.1 YbaB/EbfC family nucleoid-associated protein [Candidatus Nitrotoga sp.]MBP0126251.1 YbaB/EbfC family nucleoid-associated protein [Candidatus Nitrotoga sp.]